MSEDVVHVSHYEDGRKCVPWKVIRSFNLNFNLGCCVKYISRAGRKADNSTTKDLNKTLDYLRFEIEALEEAYVPLSYSDTYLGVHYPMFGAYTVREVAEDWDIDALLESALTLIIESCKKVTVDEKVANLKTAISLIEAEMKVIETNT